MIVAVMINSSSLASMLASCRARRAASAANVAVVSPSETILRVLIPVRVVIHSSFVSMIFVKSSFVSFLSGRHEPLPARIARRLGVSVVGLLTICFYRYLRKAFCDLFVNMLICKSFTSRNGIFYGSGFTGTVANNRNSIDTEQ